MELDVENDLLNQYLNLSENGLLILKEETILFFNEAAKKMFPNICEGFLFRALFTENQYNKLLVDGFLKFENTIKGFVTTEKMDCFTAAVIYSQNYSEKLYGEIEYLREINGEFQLLFEKYEETLFVCDKDGTVLYLGENAAVNCGKSAEYIKGKTVYALEEERIFYPSSCVKVLQTKKPEIVIQKTSKGYVGVAVGIPSFDSKGNIDKVISVTKNLSPIMRLGNVLAETASSKAIEYNDFKFYPYMLTKNSTVIATFEKIKQATNKNSNVMLYGPYGTGISSIVNAMKNAGSWKDKPFFQLNCSLQNTDELSKQLFGYEYFDENGTVKYVQGILEKADKSIVFFENLESLNHDIQLSLSDFLKSNSFYRINGRKKIFSEITIVSSLISSPEKCMENGSLIKDLYYELNINTICIPPIKDRIEDLPIIIKYFKNKLANKYGNIKTFSNQLMEKLSAYEWPDNFPEIENAVKRIMLSEATAPEIEKLIPQKILSAIDNNYAICENNFDLRVKAFEKRELTKSLSIYGNATKAATALEMNQSTFSRKIKKYGIETNILKEI